MSARRDAMLFLAAALVPAAATGFLGMRALRNEESALRREAIIEVSREAEQAAIATRGELERAERALALLDGEGAASDEPAQLQAFARAAELTPPFAEAVVLSDGGKVLVPREGRGADVGAERACKEAVQRLAGAARGDAVATILASCEEAQDARGRWLWPVLALSELARTSSRGLAARLVTWIELHADRLRPEERAVTAEETRKLGSAMATAERTRIDKALADGADASWSVAPALDRAARSATMTRALNDAAAAAGSTVGFGGDGAAGAVSSLRGGGFWGFVATRETLDRSLQAPGQRWSGLHPSFTASAVSAAIVPDAQAAPEGFAWVTDGLGIHVKQKDPGALQRKTTRSERILSLLIGGGMMLAIVLAWFVYRRMRTTRRTSELRTSFVAGISHELRTPLASLRMLSELLAEGRVEESERVEVAEALAREAKRMGETVDRFMAYARSERGKLVASRRAADLRAIAEDRVRAFQERHPDAGVEITPGERLTLAVDRPQIEIVIDNLLENALKYAARGQPYRVSIAPYAGGGRLSVSDGGPGISRWQRRRIFEAFERGDDRLSKATSGTGLGLFLVRTIARAHGGDVDVESDGVRQTTFHVRLPRTANDQDEEGA